jgi:hypothetical protein
VVRDTIPIGIGKFRIGEIEIAFFVVGEAIPIIIIGRIENQDLPAIREIGIDGILVIIDAQFARAGNTTNGFRNNQGIYGSGVSGDCFVQYREVLFNFEEVAPLLLFLS